MALGTWARRRAGQQQDAQESQASDSPPVEGDSASSASSESYEDDKFHLPVAHRPFILLPGWDKPPPPPPQPPGDDEGSSSGSESGETGSAEESESGGDDGDAGGDQPPQPPPPQDGFNCRWCVSFRAHGNGTYSCVNPNYQRWAGSDKLLETKSGRPVLNAERACSDWYEPAVPAPGAKPPHEPTRTPAESQ